MRKTTTLLLVFLFSATLSLAGRSIQYTVAESDVYSGYVTQKIWLEQYASPRVTLSDVMLQNATLPEDALPVPYDKFEIMLGKDLKRPFMLLRVPAYSADAQQQIRRVVSFTVHIEEAPAPAPTGWQTNAKTTATTSPLASGAWYKVGLTGTGLYKMDYDFITTKLGVNAAAVNTANIRVFGKGGYMLPEDNAVAVPEGLQENAIWVNDGGDGTLNPGDYIVFYAQGIMEWAKDSANQRFVHRKNIYEDKAFYFINFDQGPGLRVSGQGAPPVANTPAVTDYNFYTVHEQDMFNPGGIGKEWWGEDMSGLPGEVLNLDFDFDLGAVTDSAYFSILAGSLCLQPNNTFSYTLNGQGMGSLTVGAGIIEMEGIPPVRPAYQAWKMPVPQGNTNVRFDYQPAANDGVGYVNFIEINTRRSLAFYNSQEFTFRDWKTTGAGKIAAYNLGNANSSTQVWDVTNPLTPVRMNGTLNGSNYSFAREAGTLHEFAALNGTALPVPEYMGTVPNQNLQGANQVDFVIVTNPDYWGPANQLANYHRNTDGLRTLVVTTTQVYNEFSSGGQDIGGIRNLMRMFYERAGSDTTEMPRYLLLFGDASYDYKNRVANNSNKVPTFESAESYSLINSFCNDDFYSFLDDNEYIENLSIANTMDLGVGRLPANRVEEAQDMVNKIIHYKSPASLGPWKLSTTFVADDEDNAGPHMQDGEIMNSTIDGNAPIYTATKVYMDAIPTVSTPGGKRAPAANKTINDRINKGTFILNYNGHGNASLLTEERIITPDDYNNWKNINALPFVITATCDFGRFDHPEYISGGERVVLKADGGAIASLTTTQLVYQFHNREINQQFLNAQFQRKNGVWNTFGDAFRQSKNMIYLVTNDPGRLINTRKFALLGDPALTPAFPEYLIRTVTVKNAAGQPVDTIGALGEYMIDAEVTDVNGNVLTGFNGRASVTFYDKPQTVKTITGINRTFQTQNNVIYNGKVTVTNGKFSFSFIAPKDINYDMGKGKLSLYAENGQTDGAGLDSTIYIGGFSDNPKIENNPPVVRAYMNDSLFKDGGLTGSNSLLYVVLEDETGINVSGNTVGHDLTAVLDDDIASPYVMNDYYESAPNTYKKGYVNFPVVNLPDGQHSLRVKAWDVNNNSGEGVVNFEVLNGEVVQVQNLVNYPNPFSDVTHFLFEHNHPNEQLNVEFFIYNTAGSLVKRLQQSFTPGGSRSNEITWDGTGDNGAKLPSGVYVYRLKIATDKGIQTTAYQKLVIVR